MNPDLQTVNPLDFPGWDDLVSSHPEASFFHTAAWARVLSSTYGYRPVYFFSVKNGCLAGLLPFMEIQSRLTGTRGVSLPFTDECRFLLHEGAQFEEAIRPVIEYAASRRWKSFEVRDEVPGTETVPAFREYLFHEIDLTLGEAALFSGFRLNAQRNIRKGEKEGVSVERDGSLKGLRDFYRLNCLTRRSKGLPPQPIRFFENLWKHVLERDKGTLLLARYQGKCVAGAVFLHFGRKAIYKYGASDRYFRHLRANTLVMWEAIRVYSGMGFHVLSLGRTDIGQDGLRQFKLSWGSSEKTRKYVKFDMKTRSYCPLKILPSIPWQAVMARLPAPVLRAVGTVAYRHFG